MAAKETKDVVLGLAAVVKCVASVKADNKVDLSDLQAVLAALPAIKDAVEGIGAVPQELASLSEQDVEDLGAEAVAALLIADEKIKAIVIQSLKMALAGLKLVQAIKK